MNTKLRKLQKKYTAQELRDKLENRCYENGYTGKCLSLSDREEYTCPYEIDKTLKQTKWCDEFNTCEKCWKSFIDRNFSHKNKSEEELKNDMAHKDCAEYRINHKDEILKLTKDEIIEIYKQIGPVRFSGSDLYVQWCPDSFGMNYKECSECGSLSSCDSCWISNLEKEMKAKEQNNMLKDNKEVEQQNIDSLKEIVKNMNYEQRKIAIGIIEHENYMDKVKSVVSNFEIAENMTDLDKQDLYEYIKEIKDIASIMHFTEDDWIQFASDFTCYCY